MEWREFDPDSVRPCLACGSKDVRLESMRPLGRTQDVWRIVCSCGQVSQQWSVSPSAAVRIWNRNLADDKNTNRFFNEDKSDPNNNSY